MDSDCWAIARSGLEVTNALGRVRLAPSIGAVTRSDTGCTDDPLSWHVDRGV